MDNLSVGSAEDLANVTAFERYDSVAQANSARGAGCGLIVGGILDETLVQDVAAGMDVIVHLAANTGVGPSVEDPRSDCIANVIGTLNLLEAARQNQVPRFVFASSGAPVGEVEPPIHEELAPHPVSPYGASKLAGEGYCSAYYRTFGIETVALRFGNVYGVGSTHKNSVVAKFAKEALNGEAWEIYGDGTQTRDFIYIEDLVDAIEKAASVSGIGGETFQIATNSETTVLDLANRMEKILANHGVTKVRMEHGETRLGDVKRNFSDTRKARARLGWTATHTLDQGLEKTLAYFVKHKPVKV